VTKFKGKGAPQIRQNIKREDGDAKKRKKGKIAVRHQTGKGQKTGGRQYEISHVETS